MLNAAAYYHNYDDDHLDTDRELSVLSCGHMKLVRQKQFATSRPQGRRDCQILYMARGQGHFHLNKEQAVGKGQMIFYPPGSPQEYHYLLEESPDVYWCHFSGTCALELMESLGLHLPVTYVGIHPDYIALFENILRELQLKSHHFEELAALYLRELLLRMSRSTRELQSQALSPTEQFQSAIHRMHQEYASHRPISEYAQECNVSLSWYMHRFREYTGMSPQQYIIQIRINHARELLSSSPYNITEIAALVGYDNPLYFSRIFKKNTGVSPREYRSSISRYGERT